MKAALEGFFNPDKDMSLVNHVRSVAKDLTAEDVRGSMRRCKYAFDFPLSPGDLVKAKKAKAPSKAKPQVVGITLQTLINAGLLKTPQKLARKYKGHVLEAVVAKDGTVLFQGKSHPSLSMAGQVAIASTGGRQRDGSMRTVNGWDFWTFIGPDGKRQPIGELRKRLADHGGAANAAS